MGKSQTQTKTDEGMTWDESARLIVIDYRARELRNATDNYYRGLGK